MAEPTLETALGKVIGKVKDPYFLTAIAFGILLVLVAVAGPEGGQVYAALLAAVFLLVAVLRVVLELRSDRGGPARPAGGGRGNEIDASGASMVDDNQMTAGGGGNRIVASGKSRVRRNRLTAGRPPTPDR